MPASPDANLMWGEDSVEALDRYCLLVDALGLDATSYNISTGIQLLGNGCAVDRYGRIYHLSRLGEPTIVEGPTKEPSDVKGYDMASRLRPDDFSRMQYIVEKVGRWKAHIIELRDVFKTGWLLRGGVEIFLVDLFLNPQLVPGLARIATDFALATVDVAAQVGSGWLPDEWGFRRRNPSSHIGRILPGVCQAQLPGDRCVRARRRAADHQTHRWERSAFAGCSHRGGV